MPFRVHHIDHVEVFVPDRYDAAKWYSQALGLEIIPECEDWAKASGGPLMIGCADGTGKMALFAGEPAGTRQAAGHHRVAFAVSADEFTQFLDRSPDIPIYNETGHSLHPPGPVDHGRSWSTYFCDPWGNRYEVTTYGYDEVSRFLSAHS